MLRDPWVTVEHVDRGRAQDPGAAAVNDQDDLDRDFYARQEAAHSRRRFLAVESVEIETGRRLDVAARDALLEARASLGSATLLCFTMTLIDAERVESLERLLEQFAIGIAIAAGR